MIFRKCRIFGAPNIHVAGILNKYDAKLIDIKGICIEVISIRLMPCSVV